MTTSPKLHNFSLADIRSALDDVRLPFSVALIGSDNYFNAGAVVRTLHCFLGQKLYLINTPKLYKRAAMAAYKYEKNNIVHFDTCEEFETFVGKKKRNLVVFERRPDLTTQNICTFQYPENPILVFGNEKTGMPEHLLKQAVVVSIPMLGLVNDLNLACAVGIGCYDFVSKHMCSI
jgi:tRNA G18 (ribose-2'-O)-methylase SpoU